MNVVGDTTVNKAFVKGQLIHTGAKIENIDANGAKRIVGQVYFPTGEIVEGASTFVVTEDNKDEIKEVQLGSVKTCHTQKLKNGEAVGDLIDEVLKRKEPQKRIIKIGTKPVTNTETKDKEVLVEVTYKYDDTKDKDTVEKGQYTPDKVETKVVSKVVDGKVANTEETVVTPDKQIIKVGTKITEDTCKLPNAAENPTGTPGEPETP